MINGCNKKEKKCCGVSKVVIPAALGDENGEYKPQNGAYSNTLVEYQASGVSYLYSNDGIPTRMGDGIVATIEVGETTTLQPGESATVENTGDKYHAVFNFGIPKGDKGDKGDTGATGATGATGQAATIAVGSTTTLTPGSSATVTNSGTSSAATFNFGIPQGVKGDTGSVKSAYVTSLPSTGNENTYYLNGDTATTGSVSGTAVQITNADNTGEISDFKLNGNTEQTTYSGKNKLPIIDGTATTRGITATVTDGILTLNGTSTGSGILKLTNGVEGAEALAPSETWLAETFPITNLNGANIAIDYQSGTSPQASSAFRIYGSTSTYINQWYPLTSDQATAWTSDTQAPSCLCFFFGNGITFSNYKITLQIESGSTATSFEKFVGGIPSPNPDYPQAVNVVTGEQVVKVEGKNLFDNTLLAKGSVTVTDGVATGTAQQFYSAWNNTGGLLDSYPTQLTITAEAYTDGNDSTASTTGLRIRVIYTDNTSDYASWPNNTSSYTLASITTNVNKTIKSVVFSYNSSASNIWHIRNVQLELGNQATTYEAFRGTDYEVNLGKNLLQNTLLTEATEKNGVTVTPNADGTFTLNGTATANGYFNLCHDGTILTASTYVADVGSTTKSVTTGNFTYSASITNGRIFSVSYDNSNKYWFFVTKSGETYNNAILKIQLERGTTATSYAPYFTPIELCKIGTYQDYIWNDNGTWKVHKAVKKVVLDGTEGWLYGGLPNVYYTMNISGYATSNNVPVSDYFTGVENVSGASGMGTKPDGSIAFITSPTTLRFYVKSTKFTDASGTELTTWLGTHNTTVYYALATATDTAITESALITQLDNLVSAELLSGVNNIMLVPANQPDGTMSIDYTTWDKHDRYDVYIWNDAIGDYQLIHAGGGNN